MRPPAIVPVVSNNKQEKKIDMTTAPTSSVAAPAGAKIVPVSLTESLRSDATDAVWRTASKTAVRVVKGPLIANMKTKFGDNAKASMLAEFLSTEQGEAFLSLFLGLAPLFIPQLSSDPRVVRIAAESRVRGIQYATDEIVELIAEPIIAAFAHAASAVPAEIVSATNVVNKVDEKKP